MSHKSKSLFPGLWLNKGWLEVHNRGLSRKVEENSPGDVFSIKQNLQVAGCDAESLSLQRVQYEKIMDIFNRRN